MANVEYEIVTVTINNQDHVGIAFNSSDNNSYMVRMPIDRAKEFAARLNEALENTRSKK